MEVLVAFFPKWRQLAIHESSPGWDRVSQRLSSECNGYVASQWDTSVPFGTSVPARLSCQKYVSQDLEQQTFEDASFDVVVTQDVFEHIFNPDRAIREIARTLKPGGAFIGTVPIVRKQHPSRRRARMVGGKIEHILEPQYHGNPIDSSGSLVTVDWGYDIASYLQHHSGLSCILVQINDLDRGIRADLIDVVVALKRPIPPI